MQIISELPDRSKYNIIEKNITLANLLNQPDIIKEPIIFKNETDLQQHIQQLLPPKEVVINTILLMQDAENIFELPPSERLQILKNIFNLLSIDEAKEKLAEKKKELRYQIKAKTDLSRFNKKLQSLINSYLSSYTIITTLLPENLKQNTYQEYFSQLNLIKDNLTIDNFSIDEFPIQYEKDINTYLTQEQQKIQEHEQNITLLQQHIQTQQQEHQYLQSQITTNEKEIQTLQKNIEMLREETLTDLQKQYTQILQEIALYDNNINKEILRNYITTKQLT